MQRSPNFKLTRCRNTTTPARTIAQHKAWHSSSGEGYDTWDFFGDLRIIYCLVKMQVWGSKFHKKFLATFCLLSGNLKCTSAAMGSLNSCGVCEALAGWTLGEWGFGPVILWRDLFAFRKEEKSCDYAFQAQHHFGHEQLLRNMSFRVAEGPSFGMLGCYVQSFWVPPRVGAGRFQSPARRSMTMPFANVPSMHLWKFSPQWIDFTCCID